jgi:4-amino-4-deoxy-L-arabinose transferase-like glycosyltransferase
MYKKLLLLLIILAALLRLTFLNTHMNALYGDEISIGYNAWSILHTGKDEFGKFLPLQFESWGDQKNPVYIYLVALCEIPLGLTSWSVRVPSALAGVLAILLTYLLTKQIFKLTQNAYKNTAPQAQEQSPTDNTTEKIALIAGLLLTLNPWHLHISRGGYEANVALTLGLLGAHYLCKWFIQIQETRRTTFSKSFFLSLVFFILAMYTYYTTKMFVPLLIVLLWVWGYYQIKTTLLNKSDYLHMAARYIALFALCCIPIIYLAFFANGQSRFAKINIFNNPKITEQVNEQRSISPLTPSLKKIVSNKPILWIRDFFYYYFDNLSGDFWYIHGDSTLRYGIGDHGMFYLIEAPFLLAGILFMFRNNKRAALLLLAWLLLAPIPTSLVGKSYGLRSIAMLPIPMIFTAYGLIHLATSPSLRRFTKPIYVTSGILLAVSTIYFLLRYCCIYPVYGYYWYDGMQKDAVTYALENTQNYDNIIISKYYGKTEMYFAFYEKMDPAIYQICSTQHVQIASTSMVQCGKYYFGDIDTKGKSFDQLNLPPKTLVIGAPVADYGTDTIIAKDDKRILFRIIK